MGDVKYASEAAENLAAELKVDASSIKGSGSEGAITAADVRNAAEGGDSSSSTSGNGKRAKLHGEPVNAAGGHRPHVVYEKDAESGQVIGGSGTVKDVSGSHYCPGCGLRYASAATCTGTAEAPHDPIETAPVSELDKAEKDHTPAPATGEPA